VAEHRVAAVRRMASDARGARRFEVFSVALVIAIVLSTAILFAWTS
jgi:hypothetical protein